MSLRLMTRAEITKEHYRKYNNLYAQILPVPIMQAYTHKDPYITQGFLAGLIDFKKNDHVLDAGSGWGGPAIFFAKNFDIKILGINNNKQQVLWSNQYTKKEKVKNVSFKYHDFHELYSLPSEKCFDKILFLQSIGHSKNLNHILKECRKVLAEDGTINIYTMFGKSSGTKAEKEQTEYTEKCYGYNPYKKDYFIKQANDCGYDAEFFNTAIDFYPHYAAQFEHVCSQDDKNWEKLFNLNMKHGWECFDMEFIKLKKQE